MSLSHARRHKVSFVESPDNTDIGQHRLSFGGENVHMHARIDDESSWFRAFGADQGDAPHLARPSAPAARTGPMDRSRYPRRRTFLERRRSRGRKAVLAGLNAAR